MKHETIDWLLQAQPWVEYRTRIDLLEQPVDSPQVMSAREKMVNHPQIKSLINEAGNWPGTVLNSHKSAGQLYHKLSFIADLGLNQHDPGISAITGKIFEHISDEGPFQLPTNVPVHFGGTGKEQYAWALCDAPVIVYSLAKLGLRDDYRVANAKNFLVRLGRNNGYPCIVSKELGKFRGPGKKEDPCPYATMIMLKLINQFDDDTDNDFARNSVESLLDLWSQSTTKHPYMFYMGTDFRKLKAPFIWYDILHLTDTLSNFKFVTDDKRFIEMMKMIEQKGDHEGKFTPGSEWKAWKEWDFGQKKQPSAWLTFLVYRIRKRAKL